MIYEYGRTPGTPNEHGATHVDNETFAENSPVSMRGGFAMIITIGGSSKVALLSHVDSYS